MRTLLLLMVVMLSACGGNGERTRMPEPGPYFGQAVWLTYFSPPHARYGRRTNRVKKQALHLAERLRREVLAGADVGRLAREHSNAPGGIAEGITPMLPGPGQEPGPRARALEKVAVGDVTEVVEWLGGFWFAKRIDVYRAAELETVFDRMSRERAKFRAIALLHREAWIADPEVKKKITRTKAAALRQAGDLLGRIQRGEDFATLAEQYTEDLSGKKHGGLITLPKAEEGWEHYVRRIEPGVPQKVLEVVFASRPGELHPRVVDTPRGVFVIRTEDRRTRSP